MEFSSVALRLGLRFLDCARCALVFAACGSFRIRGSRPCPPIAGHGRCRQIWRKRRSRIPSRVFQWLGKPVRSDRPGSSGAPLLHHEKEYHSVPWCPGRRQLQDRPSLGKWRRSHLFPGNRPCRQRYDLISVVMLPARRRPQMRRPTTPPPFGPRIQTLGISVLFAIAGQCTTTPFELSRLRRQACYGGSTLGRRIANTASLKYVEPKLAPANLLFDDGRKLQNRAKLIRSEEQ